MTYSIPYLIVLFIFGGSALSYEYAKSQETKKYISIFVIVVFYIFFAFRGYVYTDWINYAKTLQEVEFSDIFQITSTEATAVVREPGFTLLCWLCSLVTRQYAFLVVVITTIDLWLFLRFLRKWDIKNIAFAFMLFFSFGGVSTLFNLMRNQLAIFIFMNALQYIAERKPAKYFLLCTLALCFHSSSIIFFPLYFFAHFKTNKYVFIALFIGFFAFYMSKISIVLTMLKILGLEGALGEKAELYTTAFTTARALSPTGTLEKFGLSTLIFLYYDELKATVKYFPILINCLLIYFFMYYVLAEFNVLSSRLAGLFLFTYWVVWIYIIKVLYIPSNRVLLAGILFLYCVYMTALAYNIPAQQYDNLLFGGKSESERLQILQSTYDFDQH